MAWVWLLLLLPLLFRGPRLILLAALGIFSFLTIAFLAVVGGVLRSLVFSGAARREPGIRFGRASGLGTGHGFGFGSTDRTSRTASGPAGDHPRDQAPVNPDSAKSQHDPRAHRSGGARAETDPRPYDPGAVVDARFEELE